MLGECPARASRGVLAPAAEAATAGRDARPSEPLADRPARWRRGRIAHVA
jgi:hypothetical protein